MAVSPSSPSSPSPFSHPPPLPSSASERIRVGVRVRPAVIPGSAQPSVSQAGSATPAWLIDGDRAELQLVHLHQHAHQQLQTSESLTSSSSPATPVFPASPPPLPSSAGGAAAYPVFAFDCVFPPPTLDGAVYERLVAPLVDCAVRGINGTVFAYGQTSSGKTYTMTQMRRLAAEHLFSAVQALSGWRVTVTASFLEVYNEQLRDLLPPLPSACSARLRIREHPALGVHVTGLREEEVRSAPALLQLSALADSHRAVASTAMNERSSRAHSICRITIRSRGERETRQSSLQLIDLAGSERCAVSQTSGARLKEGGHINRSLLTLSTVIGKLSSRSSDSAAPAPPSSPSSPSPPPLSSAQSSSAPPAPHIPYRDSTLTRILQPALGGNSRTAIIACINESSGSVDESLSTLRFALQAKQLRTTARVNAVVDPKDAAIAQLQRSLQERTEAELRWKRKFHRLSTSLHSTHSAALGCEENEAGRLPVEGEMECGGSVGSPLRSDVCPVSSSPPLLDIVEEGGGEVDDEDERRLLAAMQRRKEEDEEKERSSMQWEARMRAKLLQLQRRFSPPTRLADEPCIAASDAEGAVAAVEDAESGDLEALLDRLSALACDHMARREQVDVGLTSSIHTLRQAQQRWAELRAEMDGCRAAFSADLLQLRSAWHGQQMQTRLTLDEQQRKAAEREAELQAQLRTAQEGHAELSGLLQCGAARVAESRRREGALEAELAALRSELQRTKRLVPTPAMLQQLAKATRSVQAATATGAAAMPSKAASEQWPSQREPALHPALTGKENVQQQQQQTRTQPSS